jgi:DNA-directed RNA polymerase subunit RPC12/RpoP
MGRTVYECAGPCDRRLIPRHEVEALSEAKKRGRCPDCGSEVARCIEGWGRH